MMRGGGPLAGISVVEVASIGPGPFCAMMLADLGASVTRVERVTAVARRSAAPADPLLRGRRASIGIDLKAKAGARIALEMVEASDVLIEGFRPGVMERLGLGPEECMECNPRLVYGRVTGWGQDGPRSARAGHDIDYIAVAGVLHAIGDAGRPPVPPLNMVADFGGGGMLLAVGVMAALLDRVRSGAGQVVDAAMVEGASLQASMIHGLRAVGSWSGDRSANLLDGAAPFYRTYETADGEYVAVGALEPQFYAELLDGLGVDQGSLGAQYDRSSWPETARRLAEVFSSRTRAEWEAVFGGTDACVVGVRALSEAADDPQLVERGAFVDLGGVVQPSPAPRFSRHRAEVAPARPPGADTDAVLAGLGHSSSEIQRLRDEGVVA